MKISGVLCDPQKEAVEQEPGLFRVWIKCSFKKSDFKLEEAAATKDLSSSGQLKIKSEKSPNASAQRKYIKDSKCFVSLAVIPACESILIKSSSPRIQRCSGNPVRMTFGIQDTFIIRSPGYKSQEIHPECRGEDHVVEVILEPM